MKVNQSNRAEVIKFLSRDSFYRGEAWASEDSAVESYIAALVSDGPNLEPSGHLAERIAECYNFPPHICEFMAELAQTLPAIESPGLHALAEFTSAEGYDLDVSNLVGFLPPSAIRLSPTLPRRSAIGSDEVVGAELDDDGEWVNLTPYELFDLGFTRIFFRGGDLDGLIGTLEETEHHGVTLTIDWPKR